MDLSVIESESGSLSPTSEDSEESRKQRQSKFIIIEREYMELEYLLDALTELTSAPTEGDPEASNIIDQVYTIALQTAVSTEHLRLMGEAIHKKWLSESGFAPIAAKICYRLGDITADDIPFWNITYSLLWTDYQDRSNVRRLSHAIFANSAQFAFEFFDLFYTGYNCIYQVLVESLFDYALELVDDRATDEEIDKFHLIMAKMGKRLESLNQTRMAEVLLQTRKRLIEYSTSNYCRSMLLEILELHEREWDINRVKKPVRKLYASYNPANQKEKRRGRFDPTQDLAVKGRRASAVSDHSSTMYGSGSYDPPESYQPSLI